MWLVNTVQNIEIHVVNTIGLPEDANEVLAAVGL